MARIMNKLSPRKVATAKPKRGRPALVIGDGGGLYLQCTRGDGDHIRKSWLFKFERNGRRREMGLGATHTVSLAEARDEARRLRQQLLKDSDPLEAKEADRRAKLAEEARAVTFEQCAEQFFTLHEGGWGHGHSHQWRASLARYAYPVIGKMAVGDIEQAIVMKVVGG